MRARCEVVTVAVALIAAVMPASAGAGSPLVSAQADDDLALPLLESADPAPSEMSIPSAGVSWSASQPASAPSTEDLGDLTERVEDRTERSRTLESESGVLVLQEFDTPIHYETTAGWELIDNDVTPDPARPGWVATDGNSWSAAFGPANEGMEIRTESGTVSMIPLILDAESAAGGGPTESEFTPVEREVEPRVSPGDRRGGERNPVGGDPVDKSEIVTYRNLQPGVDLRYTILADGVKEDILIADAASGSTFGFDVGGASLALTSDGGIRVEGPLEDELAVPPPTVVTATGTDATKESGVRYDLVGADRVMVHVDQRWLDSLPASAFPVAIDPTWSLVEHTGRAVYSNPTGGTRPSFQYVRTGRESNGRVWRSAVRFNQWAPYMGQNYSVYRAVVLFSSQNSGGVPRNLYVYDEGATSPGSWAAVGGTPPLVTHPFDAHGSPRWYVDVTQQYRAAFDGGVGANWLGLRGDETGTTSVEWGAYIEMHLLESLPPSHVTNVANNDVLSTTTPLLQAQPVSGEGSYQVNYDFQITTSPSPGSGQVLSSGGDTSTSWQVPPGALAEGVTYYAWVLTDYRISSSSNPLPTIPTVGRKFTVDLGLGEGGPSPTDEVGSVPGEASSPSEGAPGPSVPGSKVTVNLVNGNLSLSTGTRAMETLSGPLALGFAYNSQTINSSGLRGHFYNDTNVNGEIDGGDVLVGQRVDPTVSFDWGYIGRPVAGQDLTKALARWTGFVTLPFTGDVQVGAISSDGLRVTIGSTERLDRWASHEPEATPSFGSSFAVTAGTTLPITVEWRNTTDSAVARVFVREANYPDDIYPLSPSWLTHSPAALPAGWTLNAAAGSGRWVGLHDYGTSVAMYAADGSAHEFVASGDGAYAPPVTAPNDLLAPIAGGGFVLEDAAGTTYTFRADGVLESIVSATDDRNPARLRYGYTGTPARLTTITDPVSNRSVTLSYGGDPACPGAPPAANGMLCHVAFWDGQATILTYFTSGRLARIANPGDIFHDFGYDSAGRIAAMRDPLAYDAIVAGVRANDTSTIVSIAYDSSGRVSSVTSPAPAAGALRPKRTYSYNTASRTGTVHVAGFSPTIGFAQRVTYDERNRITETTGADGLSSAYTWDELDRLIGTTDAAGVRTTTVYDNASRPVATYGPAPAAWFQSNGLPVSGQDVPIATRTYDAGIDALGATFWDNPDHAGGPDLHDTGGLAPDGSLNKYWGTTPPVIAGPSGWSARFDGLLEVPATGDYEFALWTMGREMKVWVDETLVTGYEGSEPASGQWATDIGAPVSLEAGMRRIQIDMEDPSGEAGMVVWLRPAGGTWAIVPGSQLEPNYGLVTSETDPDGKVTATEYSDPAAGIGPHHGLVTATVVDPGGLNLRTTVTYETPGPGTYLRRVARTLPAGNTTTSVNYDGTEGPIAAVCGVGAGTAQAGFPKQVTDPDPDGPGPELARTEQFVYDSLGRQVGRRVGNTSTIGSAGWQCTAYDSRGRTVSQSWPAHAGSPARTVSYTYAVGGDPLTNAVSDDTWPGATIEASVDLLGRTVSYTDVWGHTTPTDFDQAGRQVSTEVAGFGLDNNYDPANGRLVNVVFNGYTMATNTYDTAGRLASTAYLNGSASVHTYDDHGRPDGLGIINSQGRWAGEFIERSLAGRVIDEDLVDPIAQVTTDPNPTGDNYAYDGAGRLIDATITSAAYTYGFGAGVGCPAPDAGKNTNRSAVTVTGVGATTGTSCYDHADRLVSTDTIPATEIGYDDHGNNTQLGDTVLEFDSADRHIRTITPSSVVSLHRDPLDRIAERTHSTRIGHVATATGSSSSSSVSVSRPAGVQVGDLMVVAVSSSGLIAPGFTTGSGWTNVSQSTSLESRTAVLTRYATGSDPASWTFTSGNATASSAAIVAYRSAAPISPVAVTNTASQLLATAHPVPNVTTAEDADLVIHATGLGSSSGMSVPSGTTERAQVSSSARLQVLDREQLEAGTVPGKTVHTGSAANSASVTIAIKPATQVARYRYTGHNDASAFSVDGTGASLGFSIPLPGGAIYTWTPTAGWRFSHADLHGDVIATTRLSGQYSWYGVLGPYGEQASIGTPDNAGAFDTSLGWHGGEEKVTDGQLVHMGARPYSPVHGRFLAVDPIEGGCANDYTYVHGDPVNSSDLGGRDHREDAEDDALCKYLWDASKFAGYGGIVRGVNALIRGDWRKALTELGVTGGGFSVGNLFKKAGGVLAKIGGAITGIGYVATYIDAACSLETYAEERMR